MSRCRVAVVGGAGFWGAYYLRAYSRHPRCELVALVDTARDRRTAIAQSLSIPAVYDTVHDLLDDQVPDILTLSLPVAATHDAVVAAASSGVRTISCEKPIAVSLAKADEMVAVCRDRNIPLVCGTALWEVKCLNRIAAWVAEGHIGTIQSTSIPAGLPQWVSGNGCVPLNWLRFATGMEAEWVEDGRTWPALAADTEDDCGASGTIGLSGGVTCEIPTPAKGDPTVSGVHIQGSQGSVRVTGPAPQFFVGSGDKAQPVVPSFLHDHEASHEEWLFSDVVESIFGSCETGGEAKCSGHDYRQFLEIALALKLSAREGGRRVELPLADRHLILNPAPWRLLGGDVAGWIPGLEPPETG